MIDKLQDALLRGNKAEVEGLVDEALASGMQAAKILNEGLIVGMERLGEMFKNNEVFIPEVLVSSRAMQAGLAKLEPFLVKEKVEPRGVVVIGTVKGDLHDIGKNLVAMMLRGAGYKVVDLGTDVSPEKFTEAARASRATVVGLSALLTTTMVHMQAVIVALRGAGLSIPVVVGGAPLTQGYADEIQAGGFAPDAASAVDLVNRLAGKSPGSR
jgi:5-methyltetrahydrofolate--homocysteine methyltransferase